MITTGCFLSYFLFGFIDNIKGPTLPAILADVGYRDSLAGTLIATEYLGFFMATFLAGVMADRFGKKVTLLVAGGLLCIGVTGFAASSALPLFLLFLLLIGMGAGSLELGGSNIMSAIHTKNRGKYLNLLNAFYGVGAFVTPILTGMLLDRGVSWRNVYVYSLFIIVPIAVYFIMMKFPKEQKKKVRREKASIREIIPVIRQKEVLLMYVVIFFYVSAEIGVGTWLVNFLQIEKHVSVTRSSMYLSIHFIGMAAGRFFGSFFVDKVGHLKSIMIFSGAAAFCIGAGTFGPESLCVMMAGTGLGFSIIFPTSTAVISGMQVEKPGTMLGLFLSVGGIGGMFGPWATGIANDIFGLRWGMGVNMIFCILVTVAAGKIIVKKETIEHA